LSFHGGTHSGRLIKAMLTGTDGLFATWLVFFRDQLSTILSAVVLLPMTLFLNWRLGLVLIVLVAVVPVLYRHRGEENRNRATPGRGF